MQQIIKKWAKKVKHLSTFSQTKAVKKGLLWTKWKTRIVKSNFKLLLQSILYQSINWWLRLMSGGLAEEHTHLLAADTAQVNTLPPNLHKDQCRQIFRTVSGITRSKKWKMSRQKCWIYRIRGEGITYK